MLQNLQNDAKFQKFQLDNLVDFEKCCKTLIYLQKSAPIQPKTSNILPTDALCVRVGAGLLPADRAGGPARRRVLPAAGRRASFTSFGK